MTDATKTDADPTIQLRGYAVWECNEEIAYGRRWVKRHDDIRELLASEPTAPTDATKKDAQMASTINEKAGDGWIGGPQSASEPTAPTGLQATAVSVEAQLAEANMLLAAVDDALHGRPLSDFELSFPIVRKAADLESLQSSPSVASPGPQSIDWKARYDELAAIISDTPERWDHPTIVNLCKCHRQDADARDEHDRLGSVASPGPQEEECKHDFKDYVVCCKCGQTAAATDEQCHHCADPDSLRNGRWCLRPTSVVASPGPHLFRWGDFRLHSGESSPFKVDCDALTDADLVAVATWMARMLPPFGFVEEVPTGGIRLAKAFEPFAQDGYPPLIVDDVLTTGASMEQQRAGREVIGFVLFARRDPPPWVMAMWRSSEAIFAVASPRPQATEVRGGVCPECGPLSMRGFHSASCSIGGLRALKAVASPGPQATEVVVTAGDLREAAIAAECQATIHNDEHPGSGNAWSALAQRVIRLAERAGCYKTPDAPVVVSSPSVASPGPAALVAKAAAWRTLAALQPLAEQMDLHGHELTIAARAMQLCADELDTLSAARADDPSEAG